MVVKKPTLPKRMSSAAYQNAIDIVGLSQVGASKFFGVSRKTSPRWARGEAPVPVAVEKLLKVLIQSSAHGC